MIYIIDANNLAGKLNILKEKNFDKKLIELITNWVGDKKHKVYLVFDGIDLMGDKYKIGNITIIHTPKDSYYKSADDKIIELAQDLLNKSQEEIIVITDDSGIIQIINDQHGNKIKIAKASNFAKKTKEISEDEDDDKNLSPIDMNSINEELLRLWK